MLSHTFYYNCPTWQIVIDREKTVGLYDNNGQPIVQSAI